MKTSLQFAAKLTLAIAGVTALGAAQATVVEPFTGGQLSAPGWSQGIGADASIYLTTAAPDGSYGIALSEGQWSYNTSISFAAGQTLSAWINPGPGPATPGFDYAQGGRLYVGFDAGAAGAFSFVAASDDGKLGFQNNAGYASDAYVNSTDVTYGDQWYLLTVGLSNDGHTATANLFGTDGTTLISSLTETGLTLNATGIALRGTGGAAVTSIGVVPEPASYALALVGLGLVGAVARRRR